MIQKPKLKMKRRSRQISRKREVIQAVLLVLIIAAVLRIFVVTPFKIESPAMQNGLYTGDFLLTSKLSYKMSAPKVGDLVLFEHPLRPGENLVRRVIATEGQTVEISGKAVYVNGEPLKENLTVQHSDYRILPHDFSNRDYANPDKVPPGHVYVLGDNRDQSEDSRSFGFVANNTIEGKGLFVYFSWTPDPQAPKMKPPYIIPALQILVYDLYSFPSRVRWDRLFSTP